MGVLKYETLRFSTDKNILRVVFMRYFTFTIPIEDVRKIGAFDVEQNGIIFHDKNERKFHNKFQFLLAKGFKQLQSVVTGKPATYIHRNSGIPLIGSRYIGIQDRGTNFLEVKPITGCTMGCIFCSVDEGIGSKKAHDFVVEKEYLVHETKKLLDFKKCDDMQIYINVHGEPLLYYDIVGLVHDLATIQRVKNITLITTGILLTKELIDELVSAGLTAFNISISAMDAALAKTIMGTKAYDIKKIKYLANYAASKVKTIIAPVWVDDINDAEMEKIIAFSKSLNIPIRIQKFCYNSFGRNPVEEISWKEFFEKIKGLEKKTGVSLMDSTQSYMLAKTKELIKPFKKGEIIEADIVSIGRYSHERLCTAKDRLISVPKCNKDKGKVRIRILKTTHNIFVGEIC